MSKSTAKILPFAAPTLAKKGFIMPSGKTMGEELVHSMGAFDAARSGRRLKNWDANAGGPNLDLRGAMSTLRARARDAIRNNPWAAGALETYTSNVIGTGITPRWILEDEKLKKEIQQLWDDWTEEADADGLMDFYGLQALVTRTLYHSGECLIRFRPRRISDGLAVPLQLQVLEPDYLSENENRISSGGNPVYMGIEFDKLGRRTAYHVYKSHPAEELLLRASGLGTIPIPANQMLHVYRVERPGQLRGVPWLTPALLRLFLVDQYEDAELERKKTAALFAAFITTQQQDGTVVGFDASQVDDLEREYAELEPGILQYLLPGEDITFSAPADVGANYEPWVRQQFRAAAAGSGLTYEQMTGDLTGVNYSSIRAGLLEFRRRVEMVQHHTIVFQMCQKVAKMWLSFAVASGALQIPDYATKKRDYQRIAWQPAGWDWIDPLKDVNAAKEEIKAGLTSRERVAAARGDDIAIIDEEIAHDRDRAVSLDLKFDTDPTGTPAPAAPPGSEPAVDEDGDEIGEDGKKALDEDGEVKGPPTKKPPPAFGEKKEPPKKEAVGHQINVNIPEIHAHAHAPPKREAPFEVVKTVTARDDQGRILEVRETRVPITATQEK